MNRERFQPTWDLNALYQGFSDSTFQNRVEECHEAFAHLREELNTPSQLSPAALAELLRRFDGLSLRFSSPETYHTMWSSVCPSDSASAVAEAKLAEVRRCKASVFAQLERAMDALSREETGEEELDRAGLIPYRFLIRESRRLASHRPAPEIRDLLQTMQESGGRGWAALRNELDAAATVTLELPEGRRTISLSEARGLQTGADGALRKLAYEAELASYRSWEVPMAACLNGIKGEALAELPRKNYASIREEMLDVNKMRGETLDALHGAIDDHLPALREYLRAKARLLGHDGAMPWYDLLAPLGEPEGEISFDRAHDMVVDALNGFSSELGDLAHRAFLERWIDALPAVGKRSGGVCYDLPELRQNRILVNFDGSLRAVRTIAHELGHAYHSRCLDGTPLSLRDVPTPLCETASIFNETILSGAWLAESGANRLRLLDAELSEVVQTVMDVYSRYLFEDAVFAERRTHRLRSEEICSLMKTAQRTVFGDALDDAYLHPYMWMCKVHYYIPEFHYYNYPYYFGMLFSKGLYALYHGDRSGFPARYRTLLALSCDGSLEEVARSAGADITDRAFWDRALSGVDKMCEEFCGAAR